MQATLQAKIEEILGQKPKSVAKLFGDASYRVYYRVHFQTGPSIILMELPKGKMSASEEITNYRGPNKEIPFLNIQKYLQKKGLPVPTVIKFAQQRWIVLEDLVDTRFFDLLEKTGLKKWQQVYEKAIDLLIHLQQSTHDAQRMMR